MALRSISSGGKVTVWTFTLGSRHLAPMLSDMTSYDQNNIYVTMLSTASREIYDLNTQGDRTVKLAQSIDLVRPASGKEDSVKYRVLHLPRGLAPPYSTVT